VLWGTISRPRVKTPEPRSGQVTAREGSNDERPWPVVSRPRKANCKKPYRIRYGSIMSSAAACGFERAAATISRNSATQAEEAAYGFGLLCRFECTSK
jgi:hypothetical protein